MTKIALILVFVLGFAFLCAPTRAHISSLTFSTLTFTVDNASSDSIGTVSVVGAGDPVDIHVPSAGYFHGDVSFVPVSVKINNQTVLYPNAGTVVLTDGKLVTVSWQSNNLIDINNQEMQDGPTR
jgi:hypothetical protein